MNEKGKKLKGYLLSLTLLASIFIFSMGIMPSAQAQIVIIGSPSDDLPGDYLSDAKAIAEKLKAKGYTGNKLIELYGKNATSNNILKAMYNADAVIYIGHGGYEYGHYDGKGGTATAPFSLVGSASSGDNSGNEFIWGIGDNMRQGWSGDLFTAPFKSNIPVFLFHACFSTGDVGGQQVANPVPTIYNFASMFTGAGANYYASAFYGGDIIDEFLNGAKNFTDANNKIISIEKLTTPYYYTDNNVWRSADGSVAFMGNWAGTLASPNSTTAYDESAATAWYNSKAPTASLSYNPGSGIKTGTMVTFTGTASDPDNDPNLSYAWNFGDGSTATGLTATHSYVCNGTYKVRFKATDSYGKAYTSSKSVTVGTPPKPDLVVYSIAKSGTNIYVKVKNQGCAASPGSHVRLWYGKAFGI